MNYELTRSVSVISCIALLLVFVPATLGQQVPDTQFNTRVEEPAYKMDYPRVMFDEAHNNSLTAAGGYKPFADLIFSDGYQLVVNRKPFAKEQLRTFKILVIANGLGAEEMDDEGADKPAFTDAEAEVIHEWVRNGGSLLLIADQAPFASAAEGLAKRFAIEFGKGLTTDTASPQKSNDASLIIFSRDNKLLLDHAITRGRSETERVKTIMTFAGQSLKGPEGAETFLKLSPTAVDAPLVEGGKQVSAADRAQGIAFRAGKGRVVVLGDASMLTAQFEGLEKTPLGMNVPDNDNRQLALNIMHWLSGILK